ncbi:MAG: hypothetical protein U0166_13330 [Acidobacteriota bacterium]
MTALALAMLATLEPVTLTSELQAMDRPDGEVRWVVRLEWIGEPQEILLEPPPEPRVQNLRLVSFGQQARRTVRGTTPVSVLEIHYDMAPVRPGLARIEPATLVCGFRGERQVLKADGIGFEIPARTSTHRSAWILLAGSMGALGALALALRKRSTRAESPPPLAAQTPNVVLDDSANYSIEELCRIAMAAGVAIPDDVTRANEGFKFARQEPAPALVARFRSEIRSHLERRTQN